MQNKNLITIYIKSSYPFVIKTFLYFSFLWFLRYIALHEKCPNTELFLVRIFPHLDWIRRAYLSVFSPNAGKYGPEITPYLDTFHAVLKRRLETWQSHWGFAYCRKLFLTFGLKKVVFIYTSVTIAFRD